MFTHLNYAQSPKFCSFYCRVTYRTYLLVLFSHEETILVKNHLPDHLRGEFGSCFQMNLKMNLFSIFFMILRRLFQKKQQNMVLERLSITW